MSSALPRCLLLALLLAAAGCRTSAPLAQPQLPPSYGSPTSALPAPDTLPDWRQFFADPYLVALIDTALTRNWDVQVANQRILQAQARAATARAAQLPVVQGVVGASLRRFGLFTMDGAGNASTDIEPGRVVPRDLPDYFVGLQAAWEVDLWGRLRNQKRAAAARLLASIEGRHWVQTNLVAEVATTYYDLLALDQVLAILDSSLALQRRAFEMVQVQKEAAAATELGVKQLQAQLLAVEAQRSLTLQDRLELENRLSLLLGRAPAPIPRATSGLDTDRLLPLAAGLPASLLRARPDLRAAELGLLAARADAQAARAGLLPTFTITGMLGFQAFMPRVWFDQESVAYGLFGSLATPILNRRALRAAFQNATAQQFEALVQYEQAAVTAYVEVYNELARLRALNEVASLRSRQAEVLNQSTDISTELFRTGRATYLDVLLAQQNALQAKLELTQTRANQLKTSINLYRSLGGGWN